MPETPRQRMIARLTELKKVRQPFDTMYEDVGAYLLPWRVRFTENAHKLKREPSDKILDPTGTLALRTCVAGMAAGFCSPVLKWYRYGVPSQLLALDRSAAQRQDVKEYLADCELAIGDILQRCNFYGVTSGSAFQDLLAFAISGMFIEEHTRTIAHLKPLPMGQFWLQANAHGEIDTCDRQFPMTVAQLVESFGLKSCSALVQDQYRRHQYDVEHQVLHVVEPNRRDVETGFEGAQAGRWDWRGMDFRSVWLELGRQEDTATKFLRVAGYRDFPGVFPRWGRTSSEDVYGTGPTFEALPDIKQLQSTKRRLLQMIDKSALPPLAGSGDISGVPSQLPGAYTQIPTGGKVEAIYKPDAAAIVAVRDELQGLRYSIREALFADLWRLITDDQRAQRATAEEIRAKREERLLLLGPVGTNIDQEYLRKVHDRVFYLADRAGMLPEPPDVLADLELKVEFTSILSAAQRAQEIPAVERVAAFVEALAKIDEEVLDTLDADKFAEKYAEIAGLPPDLLRSPAAREALRKARREAKSAQDTGAAMVAGAGAAKDLSQAQLESDNGLTRLLAAMGPVAAAQAGQAGAIQPTQAGGVA